MRPAILQRAVFLGAVACPTSEELHFAVDVARINGASQDIKDVATQGALLAAAPTLVTVAWMLPSSGHDKGRVLVIGATAPLLGARV